MISNEAVEAAVREVDRFVYKPPADELPSIEGHKNALMRAVLEAAAPYMLPAPEGVSEAEIVRHMTHEEWRGCRIESYRWKFKIPGASQGSDWDWSYASHWSTPAAHEEAEALVSVKDAERALLSALSSERERAERAEKERDEARAGMAYILDRAEYGDSYGVPGSSFTACHFCQGGGAPGAEMIHDPSCPVAKYPSEVSEWFAEMTDAESRARAAEAKVKDSLRDLLAEAYLAGATDVHENYRPDPDPEFGEAAHDYAEAAALRWTETQGEGK